AGYLDTIPSQRRPAKRPACKDAILRSVAAGERARRSTGIPVHCRLHCAVPAASKLSAAVTICSVSSTTPYFTLRNAPKSQALTAIANGERPAISRTKEECKVSLSRLSYP